MQRASAFERPVMSRLNRVEEATSSDDPTPWPPRWHTIELETEILAVLDAPPQAHVQIAFAFQCKECELRVLFDRLTLNDSRELFRRLTLRSPGHRIAERMQRLKADRRARLLAFLGDARRREAIRGARSGVPTTLTVGRL
jgi:hypothetical protein